MIWGIKKLMWHGIMKGNWFYAQTTRLDLIIGPRESVPGYMKERGTENYFFRKDEEEEEDRMEAEDK